MTLNPNEKLELFAKEHADFLMDRFGHRVYIWAFIHGYKHGVEDSKIKYMGGEK